MDDSKVCRICGALARRALPDRPDFEYGVQTRLDYWRCCDCGLVFADPIPHDLIPSFYKSYSTHERVDTKSRNSLWDLIDAVTPKTGQADSFLSLQIPKSARVLDFGCGNGAFLDQLGEAGFNNLAGCDFDLNVASATAPNIQFFVGIEGLEGESFDIITLNHVLEHVEDVVMTLQKLRSYLTEGGFIYLRTPNANSYLSTVFRANWRGWETPRHLNVLTDRAMRKAAERVGGKIGALSTSNDMLAGMLLGSVSIALGILPARLKNLVGIALYVPTAWLFKALRVLDRSKGEEIVATIR